MGWRSGQRGFLLIGLLLVIIIIGILYGLYGTGGGGGAAGPGVGVGPAGGALGGSVRLARGRLCQNYLQQLRTAINLFVQTNERYPTSLVELRAGVPLQCPEGGEPYQYDPNTGQVWCQHPGHERF